MDFITVAVACEQIEQERSRLVITEQLAVIFSLCSASEASFLAYFF